MKFTDASCFISSEGVARVTVTGSKWWTDTPVCLRRTAGYMTAGMNQIPIWVKGISCIVGGCQHHKVILRGGLHYDVGHDEG